MKRLKCNAASCLYVAAFVLFVLLLALPRTGKAQREKVKNLPTYDHKPIHWGFSLGLNTMDFLIHPSEAFLGNTQIYSVENQKMAGFHLGPIANFRLGYYWDFRTLILLSFGQRNLEYMVREDTAGSGSPFYKEEMEIESTFLEFPLLLKYKAARMNNFRPYIIGGATPKIDLAARKKIKESELPQVRLKNWDIYYEAGLGADFYLPYFKLSAEIKYGAGLMNVMRPDQTAYTGTLDKLQSRMLMFSFHFE